MSNVLSKSFRNSFISLIAIAAILFTLGFSATTKAATVVSNSAFANNNLVGLIAVDRIFGNGGVVGTNGRISDLGELLVLNNLFGGVSSPVVTSNGTVVTTGSGLLNGTGVNSLAGLIAIDRIFGGRNVNTTSSTYQNTQQQNTQQNQPTQNQPTTVNNTSYNNTGLSDLGELIVLNGLFNGGLGTSLGTTGTFGSTGGTTVVVQRGDTLSGIARTFYGNSSLYPVIAQANGITNANRISVGQTLVIPSVSGVATTTGSTVVTNSGLSTNSLAGLIAVDRIFGGGTSSGYGYTDLPELLVLNSLFR